MNVSRLFVVALVLAMGGPAFAEPFKTKENCKVERYSKAFLKASVVGMTWSGPCVKGKTEGKGILVVTLKDRSNLRYEGSMRGGNFEGDGEFTDDGQRYAGTFESGFLYKGKWYDQNGLLVFEGQFYTRTYRPEKGKTYFVDGTYVDGTYSRQARFFRNSVVGLGHGTFYDKQGVVQRRVVGSKEFPIPSYFAAAKAKAASDEAFTLIVLAELNASSDFEQASIDDDIERDAVETARKNAADDALDAAQEAKEERDRARSALITQTILGAVTAVADANVAANASAARSAAARSAAASAAAAAVPDVRLMRTGTVTQSCISVSQAAKSTATTTWMNIDNGCNEPVSVRYCKTVSSNVCDDSGFFFGRDFNGPGQFQMYYENKTHTGIMYFACKASEGGRKIRLVPPNGCEFVN